MGAWEHLMGWEHWRHPRCLTFGSSDMAGMSAYVIGHHHQQNVWVEYDLQNGRVGFAPARCDLATVRLGSGA